MDEHGWFYHRNSWFTYYLKVSKSDDFPWICGSLTESWLDIQWIVFFAEIPGNPHDLHGKIYGFRLRFSLKPIHWSIHCIWGFRKMWVPQNGWFIMDNVIWIDDRDPPFISTISIKLQYFTAIMHITYLYVSFNFLDTLYTSIYITWSNMYLCMCT